MYQPTLFVFMCTTGAAYESTWPDMEPLPDGWLWLGSGSTGSASTRFPYEEQYIGPAHCMQAARSTLQAYFETLKQLQAITDFVIQDTYLPVPV